MNMFKTQCCAIQEIGGLSNHPDARDAMIAFCKTNFAAPVKFGTANARADTLYSFYLFTAATGSPYYKPYGSNFAKFIRDNKLGRVWASPSRKNEAFHSDHENQVWIWMPNRLALKSWWEKTRKAG
jgi:hypothetical protein